MNNPEAQKEKQEEIGSLQNRIKEKEDEFLDVYSLYLETGLSWIKEEVLQKAQELQALNPSRHFAI